MRTEVNQTRINGKYPTDSVYYFGIAYPVREAAGMLEEFACFLSDEDIHALSDKEILEIIHS
ncbi:hypothetical protein [uncultured Bacteroides sp.]|uniref:hypothetical protein n=1 Tax=uncultured Bacteroides sp. TaxID=162156 RepID=UPI002666839F|nr:hypothetical protein [uncultured Bacteroides sp.]